MSNVINGPGPLRFDSLGGPSPAHPPGGESTPGGRARARPAWHLARAEGGGHRVTWRLALLATASAVALAGCGQPAAHRSTATPKPSTAPSMSASPDPAAAAILQAYQTEEAAWQAASAASDPTYPGLAATMINPLLLSAKKQLFIDQQNGIIVRGGYQHLHPHVVSLTAGTSGGSGTIAVLRDCLYSTAVEVYAKTNQPVPNQPNGTNPEYDGLQMTFTEVAPGKWMASGEQEVMGQCPAGY